MCIHSTSLTIIYQTTMYTYQCKIFLLIKNRPNSPISSKLELTCICPKPNEQVLVPSKTGLEFQISYNRSPKRA